MLVYDRQYEDLHGKFERILTVMEEIQKLVLFNIIMPVVASFLKSLFL